MSAPGNREVAHRVFAAEYDDASLEYAESDEERAPNYVVTPTGARINRLFVVGVLTSVERVNEETVRARIVDPTGAFVIYAGQYQPDELAFFERAEVPAFVAITGKANAFQPEGSDRVLTSVRPESVNEVDADTRDRWVVRTAEQTLARVEVAAGALDREERGDDLVAALRGEGIAAGHAEGVARALDHYGTTADYLGELRDRALQAVEVVAGERDEADSLDLAPDEGDGTYSATDLVETALEDATAVVEATVDEPVPDPDDDPDSEEDDTGDGADDDSATAVDDSATAVDDSATADAEAETGTEATAGGAEDAGATSPDDSGADATHAATGTADSTGADATEPAGIDATKPAGTDATGSRESDPATDDSDEDSSSDEPDVVEREQADDDEDGDRLGDFDAGSDLDADDGVDAAGDDEEVDAADDLAPDDDLDAGGDVDADLDEDEMYELDDEERERIEEEHGVGFSTGNEVPEPGEADIDVPEPEGEGDAESEPEEQSDEEPAGDADVDEILMDRMAALDDGDGADREELIDDLADRTGASLDEVEDAIDDALMSGQCFEPADGVLKPI